MPDQLTPEVVAEGLRLDAARTPGEWEFDEERNAYRMKGLAAFERHAVAHYAAALREVERLRQELDREPNDAERRATDYARFSAKVVAERDTARAEVERLRALATAYSEAIIFRDRADIPEMCLQRDVSEHLARAEQAHRERLAALSRPAS